MEIILILLGLSLIAVVLMGKSKPQSDHEKWEDLIEGKYLDD